MWLPVDVKKEYAQKAYNKKIANPRLSMNIIAQSFGLNVESLMYWIHKYIDPEFKPGKNGIILL